MTCVDANRQGGQTLLHFYGLTYGLSQRKFHMLLERMYILLLDGMFYRCLLGLFGLKFPIYNLEAYCKLFLCFAV